jgi:4'-phosphopantetheinyl transferase
MVMAAGHPALAGTFVNPGSGDEARLHLLDLSIPPTRGDEQVLDTTERSRARSFLRAADRDRFIRRRAEVRRQLATELRCPPEDIAFEIGRCGRPRVVRPRTGLEFSVASSGVLGILAIGAGPLGVDLERRRPELVCEPAAEVFLTADELAHWVALGPNERVDAFYVAWTRKEAVAKACGLGMGGRDPRTSGVAFAEVAGLTTVRPARDYVGAIALDVAASTTGNAR